MQLEISLSPDTHHGTHILAAKGGPPVTAYKIISGDTHIVEPPDLYSSFGALLENSFPKASFAIVVLSLSKVIEKYTFRPISL